MHPTDFFNNVRLVDSNLPVEAKQELIDKLKNIHPMNFISSDILFQIAEIDVSYTTKKGNRKRTKKYSIQKFDFYSSDDADMQARIQAEADIDKFNTINNNSELKNFVVEDAKVMCMAVLRIE